MEKIISEKKAAKIEQKKQLKIAKLELKKQLKIAKLELKKQLKLKKQRQDKKNKNDAAIEGIPYKIWCQLLKLPKNKFEEAVNMYSAPVGTLYEIRCKTYRIK